MKRRLLPVIMTMAISSAWAFAWPTLVKAGEQTARETDATIVVGPFDLHRKYRSMEGPYVMKPFRIDELLEAKTTDVPEDSIIFIEGGGPAAAMNPKIAASEAPGKHQGKRSLLWLKGIKMQVLDEHDKPLPTAEFICHLNIDVDLSQRAREFPQAEHTGSTRVITLTQGQTEFHFPDGFAVPVASDENWTFTFQAANRTTNAHRRIKQVCTLQFVKDEDVPADRPLQALHWFNPWIAVMLDKNQKSDSSAHCLLPTEGDNAPNMVPGSTVKDDEGHELTGHWAVPTGTHVYEGPLTPKFTRGFSDEERRIHAVWTHIHPLCSESSLQLCDGGERKTIFTVHAQTRTNGGLQIEHIDDILSQEGILLPAGGKYVLHATYDNTTREAQDSMVALGIFCADKKFVKPVWPDQPETACEAVPQLTMANGANGVYCGIKDFGAPTPKPALDPALYNGAERYDLFDPAKDGPLLEDKQRLDMVTSAGVIHIALDPHLAPQHATQIYKLMKAGAFAGTSIYRYEPGFVLQTSTADTKDQGQPRITNDQLKLFRRLPLEVESQADGSVVHKKWMLSMGRWTPTDSAVTSFSIMLGDAPHLDHQYTIFGHVIPDETTLATIKNITDHWTEKHPHIVEIKASP